MTGEALDAAGEAAPAERTVVYAHDPALLEDCHLWRTRDALASRRRRVVEVHELAPRRGLVTCWACRSAAGRARQRVRDAVRKRPDLPPQVQGRCRWCSAELTGRRTSWCSDACAEWWFAVGTPRVMIAHLVGLHGHECWVCGARWEPGGSYWWGDVDRRVAGPPSPLRVGLELDHVRPLWSLDDAERGELRWWLPFNLQLLCGPCHRTKTRVEARVRADVRRGVDPGEQLALG